MATITKKNAHNSPDPGFGGVAYGNVFALSFKFQTNSSGYFLDSDTPAAAVGIGDKVILGKIPAGTRMIDVIACVSNAFTASSTIDLGFEYCDGVDDTTFPEQQDYFIDAGDWTSVGFLRRQEPTAVKTLPKDAYLILTNGVAALDEVGIIDIDIIGVIGGPH